MADENTLFGDANTDLNNVTGADALAALVGEGKKYTSVEELAKAAIHGQTHIQRLEQEAAALREAEAKAKSVDEILAALKERTNGDGNVAGTVDQQQQAPNPDVSSLIEQEFRKRDEDARVAREAANQERVKQELTKRFGEKAATVYAQAGQALGMNLDDIAAKNPDSALKLIEGLRPAAPGTPGLPPSTQLGLDTSKGLIGKAAIKAMYDKGEIDRFTRIKMEGDQYQKLGKDAYLAN